MKTKRSITTAFIWSMVAIVFLSMGTAGFLWISGEYKAFKHEADSLREKNTTSSMNTIKNETERVLDYIAFKKSQAVERLERDIRGRAIEAYDIAMNLYREHKMVKSPPEIMKIVLDALRPIRFNNGRGYYFATQMDGTEVLFADRPEMEGLNLLQMQDAQGQFVVRDMIEIARSQKEGFYRYTWTKPNQEGKNFPKIAYVIYFEPFDWFIGTGEYLDDVISDIQGEILERVERITFGRNGYVFAGRFDGLSLSGPQKGKNVLHVTDANGVKIVQELIRTAKAGGGFVRYVMPAFKEGDHSFPKMSYVAGIPEWEWYVGAGINVEDTEATIAQKKELLQKSIRENILKILLTLAGLLMGILLVAKYFSRRLKRNFSLLFSFFSRAASDSMRIEPQDLLFAEFEELGHSANRMIEERKKAEEALKDSEERFRSIVENSHDGIIIVDESYHFLYLNAEMCRILGCICDEVLGHDFREFLDEESRRLVSDHYKRRQRGEDVPVRYEFNVLRKSGEKRRVEISSAVLATPEGEIRTIAQILDITERKQAEEALRESEEKYRQLFNNSNDAIFIVQDGVITFCNPKTEELTGYRGEALARHPFTTFIHPEDREMVLEKHLRRLRGDEFESEYAFRIINSKGERLWMHLNTGLTVWEGRPATINFLRDITAQKRLESQLQQSQKMEAIGTLAGGIAHDFNNILGGIMGYAELALYDLPPGSKVSSNLEQVLKASRRASQLVKRILAFSRQGDQDRKPVKLTSIVEEALKLLRASLPSTIEIRQTLDPSSGTIVADPTQIHQVLMNLCTNAHYAMRENGGVLDIQVSSQNIDQGDTARYPDLTPGPYLRLRVSDTGEGMDSKTLERIFDPYFTTKDKGMGTGMGLAVVHGIVKDHGGSIAVESQPGKGTVFDIFFPRVDLVVIPEERPPKPPLGANEHILFVDDEESLVNLGRAVLERLGYRVSTRTSSVDALEAFRAQPMKFDLVITDMTMPNMTGDVLASHILEIRPDIPVIICTGYSEQISEEKARDLGIKALIMKPIVIRDLAEAMHRTLHGED